MEPWLRETLNTAFAVGVAVYLLTVQTKALTALSEAVQALRQAVEGCPHNGKGSP